MNMSKIKNKKTFPRFLQSAFWSYDLKKINKDLYKKIIITQILNHGTWEQLSWLINNYSIKEIKKVIKNPARGVWREDVLNYWSKILDFKISKHKIRNATFSLHVK